jgi:DMSO reductase anchor subunit
MLQTPSLVVNYEVSVITYAISTFLSISGMFIERWLFFIESKHAENQYYGKNAF